MNLLMATPAETSPGAPQQAGDSPGSTPFHLPTREEMAAQDMFNNCFVRGAMSGVMGEHVTLHNWTPTGIIGAFTFVFHSAPDVQRAPCIGMCTKLGDWLNFKAPKKSVSRHSTNQSQLEPSRLWCNLRYKFKESNASACA